MWWLMPYLAAIINENGNLISHLMFLIISRSPLSFQPNR